MPWEYDTNLFVKNIRTLREKQGWSQEELGSMIGLEQSAVSKMETQASNLSLNMIIQLSNIFEVTVESMLIHDFEKSDKPYSNLYIRRPEVDEETVKHFLEKTYQLYYLAAMGEIRSGKLELDDEFDRRRLFLHGRLTTTKQYDCKLVIGGTESFYVYGTEKDEKWRIIIVCPSPRDVDAYLGGCGIMVRKDENDYISGQRVLISEAILDYENNTSVEEYIKGIIDSNNPFISIDRVKDNGIRAYIKKLNQDNHELTMHQDDNP